MEGDYQLARKKQKQKPHIRYNTEIQYYRGIPFRLIEYTQKHFDRLRAKRFLLNPDFETEYRTQNFWIPNCYLEEDGTLKLNVFVDWIFVKCVKANKFKYAGLEIPDWMRGNYES